MITVLGLRIRDTQWPAIALLSIVVIVVLLQGLAQLIYKCRNSRRCNPERKKLRIWGPWQIWVDFMLTYCPCLFLVLGLALPAGFSTAGLVASNYWIDINLDFGTYLAAELPDQYNLDIVNEIAREQRGRSQDIRDRGAKWAGWTYTQAEEDWRQNNSRRLDLAPVGDAPERRLARRQNALLWKLEMFYQAKDPEKGIFTPEALEEIRDFENRLKSRADYTKFCTMRVVENECDIPYSVSNVFFSLPDAASVGGQTMQVVYDGSGKLADIPTILRGFLRDGVQWWVDKDFGPQNLKSQYTRATFYGGMPLEGYESINDRQAEQKELHAQYLLSLWEDLLHRTDLTGPDRLDYQHVTFTWVEGWQLYSHEVTYYLINDCLFCAGTFVIVSTLVLLRMQNLFIGFFGAIGVVLAFTATYYFHYEIMGWHRLTVLDFVSLFLIVGISADDILLLFNTYMLSPLILGPKAKPRERMAWAYREAAAAMLVTSVTTCGSFYSNCFSIVSVVRAFGFFMGTLVVWNFVNVLTIFPAAILVNDCYIIPFLKCMCCCCCQDEGPGVYHEESTASERLQKQRKFMKNASIISRQFSKEQRSTLEIGAETSEEQDLNHDKLECCERAVAKCFTPVVVKCRWLLIFLSLVLSGTFIYLAWLGFELATGDIVLFEETINLGRVEKMQSEVFPGNTVSDLNQALSVQSPYNVAEVPTCPRSGDNSTFCAGNGACDTSSGQCICQEEWVGLGCTVSRVPGTLTLTRWSPPSTPGRYEYLHVLARPSLMQVPQTLQVSVPIVMLNNGDDQVPWSFAVPSGKTWLGVDPTSGTLPARVFNWADLSFPSSGQTDVQFYLGGRSAGFAETADVTVSSAIPAIDPQTIVISAAVIQVPALTFLEVRAAEYAVPSAETPTLTPGFAVEYGFGDDDMLNLALPGNEFTVVYNVTLPFAISKIQVATAPSFATSRVVVDGQDSSGTSQELGIPVEPAITTILVQAVSAASDQVRSVYELQVVRASTTTTTTMPPDILRGEIDLTVSDCANLSGSQAAWDDLAQGIATAADVNASLVEVVSVRCAARRLAEDEERRLSGSATIDYAITLPQGGADPAIVVTNIAAETTASMTSKLQSALNGGSSGLSVTVTAISSPMINPTTTTTATSTATRTITSTATTSTSQTETSTETSTTFTYEGTSTTRTTTTITRTTLTTTSPTTTSTTSNSVTSTSATSTSLTATTLTDTTLTVSTTTTASLSSTTTTTYLGTSTTSSGTTVTSTATRTSSQTSTVTRTSSQTSTRTTSTSSTATSTSFTQTSTSVTQTSSTSTSATSTVTSVTSTSSSLTITTSTETQTTNTVTFTPGVTTTSISTTATSTTSVTATATSKTTTSSTGTTITQTTTSSTVSSTATSTVTVTDTSSTTHTASETSSTTHTASETSTTTHTASETSSTASTVTGTETTTTSMSTTATSVTHTETTTTSWTHTSSTTLTSTTLENYNIIAGSLSLEVSDCPALNTQQGRAGLANGIAETANVSVEFVAVTVTCSRRLLDDFVEAFRRLSSTAGVDYLIDLPFETPKEVGLAASRNIETQTLETLSTKLEVAVALAGVANLSLNVTVVAAPSVEAKTTTTTTTLYCPGDPPCGGAIYGTCNRASPGDPLRRAWICECEETFNGSACDERICPVCQNNGTCVGEGQNLTAEWTCECPSTHQGDRCQFLRCPSDCSNAGDCDKFTGICACFDGYDGADCSLAPGQLVPITNAIELSLTWGLQGYEEDNNSAPEYDMGFDLYDPEVQEWILDTCRAARTSVNLLVREEMICWIEGFETWIKAVGGPFPVNNSELASEALQVFMHQRLASTFLGDVATDGTDYAGRPYFTRVRLKINVAANANSDYRAEVRERWDRWVEHRNAIAPASVGPMLMVSYFFTQMELESQVLQSTFMAFGGSMATSLLAVAFFTQNAVIAFYVCLNIFLVVCVLAGFLLYWMGYQFGVVEAIGATIFVGLSVDYCLHLAHAYNEAQLPTSLKKMQRTLIVIGPSIMGGAVTTIAGTAFLLPCRMILFQKLGWTLFANSIVSVLFTFTFLTPLFIILGPTGTAGTIFCLPCLKRFAPEGHHPSRRGDGLHDAAVFPDSPRAIDEEAPQIPETIRESEEEDNDRTPYSGVAPLPTSSEHHTEDRTEAMEAVASRRSSGRSTEIQHEETL